VYENTIGATVVLQQEDSTNQYSLEVSCGSSVVDVNVSPTKNNKHQEVHLGAYHFDVAYNIKGVADFVLLEDSDMTPCKFHEGAGL